MCLQVLIVEKMELLSEYYFALVMDRAYKVRRVLCTAKGVPDVHLVKWCSEMCA